MIRWIGKRWNKRREEREAEKNKGCRERAPQHPAQDRPTGRDRDLMRCSLCTWRVPARNRRHQTSRVSRAAWESTRQCQRSRSWSRGADGLWPHLPCWWLGWRRDDCWRVPYSTTTMRVAKSSSSVVLSLRCSQRLSLGRHQSTFKPLKTSNLALLPYSFEFNTTCREWLGSIVFCKHKERTKRRWLPSTNHQSKIVFFLFLFFSLPLLLAYPIEMWGKIEEMCNTQDLYYAKRALFWLRRRKSFLFLLFGFWSMRKSCTFFLSSFTHCVRFLLVTEDSTSLDKLIHPHSPRLQSKAPWKPSPLPPLPPQPRNTSQRILDRLTISTWRRKVFFFQHCLLLLWLAISFVLYPLKHFYFPSQKKKIIFFFSLILAKKNCPFNW